MHQIKVMSVFGTRPEAIKMAPVIRALDKTPGIESRVCVTGQHQQMLNPVLELFDIVPLYNLQVMRANQDLPALSSRILQGLSELFATYLPDLLLVHGDTTSTFIAALAGFYHRIPVAHVEAGLRTGDIYSPWPEEANRKLAAVLCSMHFAPTEKARMNLLAEGYKADSIFVTGNTVIDALQEAVHYIETHPFVQQTFLKQFPFLQQDRKFILVTGHRRENFGEGFAQICKALLEVSQKYPNVDIVYPVHLNPKVQMPVKKYLTSRQNIFLIDPVEYLPFVFLMQRCYLILTDSGGIQEEAPSLGKPVLVMRQHTERTEAVDAGTVKLVGTNADTIVREVSTILNKTEYYFQMSNARNPYGDGKASQRIIECIKQTFSVNKSIAQISLQEETGII